MKKRWTILAGMVAVLGLAGAQAPSPSIKEAMAKLHKGGTAALPSLKKALAAETPDWPGITETSKLVATLSAAITDQEPPKGDKANYEKLAKAYATNAKALQAAAEKEDLAKSKASLGKLQASCKACHNAHKE